MDAAKSLVHDFWDAHSCGEELYLDGQTREAYRAQSTERYRLEPYILDFAEAERWQGSQVLEVGVGLGADHQLFAQAGAEMTGLDLTERAIAHTRARFDAFALDSDLRVGDAEALPFPDGTFDLVYSWGVIHHSPGTAKAAREILRVLKPGGMFKVMIYNRRSLIGLMLWLRYGLLAGRPGRSLDDLYATYLESPGTKAYTPEDGAALFAGAVGVQTKIELTHGDLLEGSAGQRHEGPLLTIARKIWPRWFLRRFARNNGLFLLIEGYKRPTGAE